MPGWGELGLVLAEDVVPIIEDEPGPFLHDIEDRLKASLHAGLAHGVGAVGGLRDIGVHDDGITHPVPRRSRAACVIAARSPSSSPKKSLGQFLMLPNTSTSSSETVALPSPTPQ